ncbi:glycine zipper 2TM domain-containing protein [uncultured Pseudacidovorax sp.]|uniref:glycine zipper 2TM domain-containing protein n=1 Tax=uncultured Pseudacidovorax sp. TaxID=679313 RepID=UPI0025E7BBD2|nr:glycine zipper 2TM domain-containing protein [uncultured Pseudacidovorax sp.]
MIHNKVRFLAIPAALAAAAVLSGCVTPVPVYQTSYPYQPAPAPAYPAAPAYNPAAYVETGIVANIEMMRSETPPVAPSGGGAVVGGLLGGVLGNQIGHGTGRAAATMLGVVGGALAGNAVESRNGAARVYESYRVSVQMSNGSYRSFDVPSPGDLRIGDRVRVDGNQISRY